MEIDLRVPELAYLFGVLQTDGHLSKEARNKGRVSVELQVRDRATLERFCALLPAYSSVRERTRDTNFRAGYTTATWTLYGQDVRASLRRLGLPEGEKSKTVAFPSGLYSERDYLRGLLDGDGSIGFTRTGIPFISFCTVSPHLAAGFIEYLHRLTGKQKHANPNQRDGAFNVMVNTEDAQTVARALYQAGDLGLGRKHEAAQRVLLWQRPATMRKVTWDRRRWTTEEDEVVLRLPLSESARMLGRTARSVRVRLHRLKKERSCPSSTL